MLHVGASLSRVAGGVAPALWELAQHLRSAGIDTEVVGLRDPYTETDILSFKNIPSTITTRIINNAFGYSREFGQVINSTVKNTHIVHSHGVWMYPGLVAWRAAQKQNIPLIITPHGMLEPWAIKNNWWKKQIPWFLFQKKILTHATVIHVTSEQEAENIRNLGFKNPLAIIPNAIEIPLLHAEVCGEKKLHTALFLSRLHPKKGLPNLIKAWSVVKPDNWRLLIAGPDEGGHQGKIEHEVQELGLSDQIKFIGPISNENKWNLYQSADLFVLATYSENFGIVIAEALASGLPVITTKGAPWVELAQHNCGWWIDIGVAPLVKALKEATNLSTEQRHEMGRRGRELIKQNYTWETIAQDMISVYEWVLHGGTLPKCMVID